MTLKFQHNQYLKCQIYRNNPRLRGLSEHGVFSCEECCIPAHMQGWGDQLEEDCGKKYQRWLVTRDSAWRCEHDGCNIAVFTRTLLSILHSQSRKNHLFGRKNRMVQPDSLNVDFMRGVTVVFVGSGLFLKTPPLYKSQSLPLSAGAWGTKKRFVVRCDPGASGT